jgi:hypothetical protein
VIEPSHDPESGPAADLQRYCRTLAGFLRRAVPTIRQRLDALEPVLPPAAQRLKEDESAELTYPYALAVSCETLISHSLAETIVSLEAVAAATPGNPMPARVDPELLLQELDPDRYY